MPSTLPIRALPRVFLPGINADEEFELPKEELDKLRKVLRLSPGAQIAVLPNDGKLIRCELGSKTAKPLEVYEPRTEATLKLTIAQALPKGDKLDEIVRTCTELGASKFVLFPSERTVVRWDAKKTQDRLRRLEVIAKEACEVSFRTRLPEFTVLSDLATVLKAFPEAAILSESEAAVLPLKRSGTSMTIVVGPEGGWAAREVKQIGDRGVTLGPRVLRVDHAAAAAAAILLLG